MIEARVFKRSILRELYESSCLCRKRLAAKCGVDAANAWFLNALKELCREGKIRRVRQRGHPAIYILSSYDVPQPA